MQISRVTPQQMVREVVLYMLYSTKANSMLIGPFKFFFGMDQSVLSIGKLGQVMLVRVSYMLTIDFTR